MNLVSPETTQKNTSKIFFSEATRRARLHIHKQLRVSKTFPIHTHKALHEAWKPVCPQGRLIKWVRHDWEAWDQDAATSGRIEFPLAGRRSGTQQQI